VSGLIVRGNLSGLIRSHLLGWLLRLQITMPEVEALQLFRPCEPMDGASQTWTRNKGFHEVALKTVYDNAQSVERAKARLAKAIVAAREDGCSWRQIAKAAGVPFQSLHHRFAKSEAPSSASDVSSVRSEAGQTMAAS
jgi:hypothetical protein